MMPFFRHSQVAVLHEKGARCLIAVYRELRLRNIFAMSSGVDARNELADKTGVVAAWKLSQEGILQRGEIEK